MPNLKKMVQQTIWLITANRQKVGQKLVEEIFPKVTEKAFDKFYQRQQKRKEK